MTNSTGNSPQSGSSGSPTPERDRTSDPGKKGGQPSQGGASPSTERGNEGAQRGGSGNFANDRDKASEAGRKGGEHSQGGGSR